MRKLILTSLVSSLLATPIMAKDLNEPQPTSSQFAPIVENTQIYPLANLEMASIRNLQNELIRNLEGQGQPPYRIRITYTKDYKNTAYNLRRFLIKQNFERKKIQLISKKIAIYPLYVEVQSFGRKEILCSGDNSSSCYRQHNMRLQSVVNQ